MKSIKLFYLLLLTFVIHGNYNAQCNANANYVADSNNCQNVFFNSNNSSGNTFLWTFGDGSTSSTQNTNHVYNTNGTYSVVLTVSQVDSNGVVSCLDTSMVNIVINCSSSTQCNAAYTYTIDSNNCNTVSFQAPAGYSTYQWNFTDGSYSSAQNPVHTFSGNGTYSVGLAVTMTDSSGTMLCDDSTYMNVTINCGGSSPQCNANYTYTIDSNNCNTVSFQGPAGYSTYQWNFADGSYSSAQNPIHTFSGNGTYSVGLSITLNDSSAIQLCNDSTFMNVAINCGGSSTSCNANFSFMVDSTNCSLIYFYANNNFYTNYYWSFGDENSSTSISPTHTYSVDGAYNVELIIFDYDSLGNILCADTISQTLTIACGGSSSQCDATFTASQDSNSTDCFEYNFYANTQFNSYYWDFGDGNSAQTANPSHIYGSNGTYNVTLVGYQTDSSGNYVCGDTVTISLTINCVTAIQEQSSLSINAYPNPFVDQLNVTIEANEYQEVEISILSISGAIISSNVYQLNSGTNNIQLLNNDLNNGIYLLDIKNIDSNEHTVQRIIKQ